MHRSLFFKLFPPPAFMVMRYAGLHISDDVIRFLEYGEKGGTLRVRASASMELAPDIIDGGDIKDEAKLVTALTEFDKANRLSYVKVSIPEEKAYLFETDVPDTDDVTVITQNIEFKLEENVPLSASDAVFYFDLLPPVAGTGPRATVSVVPRAYLESQIALFSHCGIFPIAFEVLPKAIARAVIDPASTDVHMIVYVMKKKTGIYVVFGNVVCFSSTVSFGSSTPSEAGGSPNSALVAEVRRVTDYWASHSGNLPVIKDILLVGADAPSYVSALSSSANQGVTVSVADVWRNAFDIDTYLPPISRADSLDFAAAAGLALNL